MSRKFLETEGPVWVAEGLISEAQRQRLLARYPPEAPVLGLLPVLGSVLVGLSGLSVVAANWQGLPCCSGPASSLPASSTNWWATT
ncbi:MAG: hypothetical protein NVSMB30_01280 [Hymenobacter sp.]